MAGLFRRLGSPAARERLGGNEEEIEPHPLVLVARREMVGGGRSTADRVAATEGLIGKGALVVDGRRGVAD